MNRTMWLLVAVLVLAGLWYHNERRTAAQLALMQSQSEALQSRAAELDASAAALQEQTRQLQEQSQHLQKQSQALKNEGESLRAQVASDREFAEQERARYLSAAEVAEGLQLAAQIKAHVVEFYLAEGVWPISNAALGLPAPDQYRGRSLRSMQVQDGGEIRLAYAENGEVRLQPKADVAGSRITWQCLSSSYPDIATLIPQCRYTGNN